MTSPQPTKVSNNFFDEAMELSESDEDGDSQILQPQEQNRGDSPPSGKLTFSEDEYDDEIEKEIKKSRKERMLGNRMQLVGNSSAATVAMKDKPNRERTLTEEEPEMDGELDNDNEYSGGYENGNIKNELERLLEFITRYSPQDHDLNPELRPFVPEFIPAIGDIDAFIKIPRCDNEADLVGLALLDEPAATQTDPSVLDLHLRAITKATNVIPQAVRSIDSSLLMNDTRPIDNWIKNIAELHNKKPLPSVTYTRRMPDIETLMQVWPQDFEEALSDAVTPNLTQNTLPSPDIDMPLKNYIELVALILDIPLFSQNDKKNQHSKIIEAVHVIFTLYSEFKNSDHFKAMDRTRVV
ncbi:Intraflagellar transport protein 46 [Terramyces sp. JEL0728]|nr:Intraflagellar transport protein 46 [Terramyces sp. JEL0728]